MKKILLFLMLFCVPQVEAAVPEVNIGLEWQPPITDEMGNSIVGDAIGYKVYYTADDVVWQVLNLGVRIAGSGGKVTFSMYFENVEKRTFYVTAYDQNGNESRPSNTVEVRGMSTSSINVMVVGVSVTVSWNSTEAGSSSLKYRKVGDSEWILVEDINTTQNHSVVVEGLLSSTLYEFEVASKIMSGGYIKSVGMTFSTLGSCSPPTSGEWNIVAGCTLASDYIATSNVVISNNSVLIIPIGVTLYMDLKQFKLLSNTGSVVRVWGNIRMLN